jgi:hypothetical protein
LHKRRKTRFLQSLDQLRVRCLRPGDQKIFPDARVEDVRMLQHYGQLSAHVSNRILCQRAFSQKHCAFLRIEEATQQIHDRALAGATRTDDCDPATERHIERYVANRRTQHAGIGERDVLEGIGRRSRCRHGIDWILYQRLFHNDLVDSSRRFPRLSDVLVRCGQWLHRFEARKGTKCDSSDEYSGNFSGLDFRI